MDISQGPIGLLWSKMAFFKGCGGKVLGLIKDVIKKGEKELDFRIKMWRIADKAS